MDNTTIHEKKDFIQRMRQHGDVAAVCKELGYTETVFWSAMRRTDQNYTHGEMEAILTMYKKMQERQQLMIEVGLTG